MIRVSENLTCGRKVRDLGLFSLRLRGLRGIKSQWISWKNTFTIRVVKHWDTETVTSPSLEMCRTWAGLCTALAAHAVSAARSRRLDHKPSEVPLDMKTKFYLCTCFLCSVFSPGEFFVWLYYAVLIISTFLITRHLVLMCTSAKIGTVCMNFI